jgi:hypothetical protein
MGRHRWIVIGEPGARVGEEPGCSLLNLTAKTPGSCDLTIISLDGQRVMARVDFERVMTNFKYRTTVGQVIVDPTVLVAMPSSVTVPFTTQANIGQPVPR